MEDSRFSRLTKDPRFLRQKNKDEGKLKIDSRFSHMLEKNSEFASASTKGKVDKRGRRVESSTPSDLKRFYKLEEETNIDGNSSYSSSSAEEEEEVGKGERRMVAPGSDSETSESDLESEEGPMDLARGEGDMESSDEDDLNEEALATLMKEEQTLLGEEEREEGPWADEDIPRGDETRRFACVNLDWDHVKAKDLYKVFDAFKPSDGLIKSVAIYPSEFGKEQMANEAVQGPPSTVFKVHVEEEKEVVKLKKKSKKRRERPNTVAASTDATSTEEASSEKPKEVPRPKVQPSPINDDGKDFNMIALRKYQVDRLRYYYAVVECNTISCARAIYNMCDGSEFESTSNFFDLRYIPNDLSFEGDEPVDEAVENPLVYTPVEFVTQALQHSKVKLTWDNDDPERQKTTRKRFNKQDLKDMDFKAYLASDSEEDGLEGEDEELKAKYKALLGGGGEGEDDDEEEGEDMEITFAPGLSEKASKMLDEKKERELQNSETVFETQLRKQKEKKKSKKQLKKAAVAAGDADTDASDEEEEREEMNDPFFQTSFGSDFEDDVEEKVVTKKSDIKKKSKEERLEKKKQAAELELLLVDDNNKSHGNHFTAKDVIKGEKSNKSKKQKKKLAKANLDTQDDFNMDLNDPRFAPLIDDHQFFIDPTNPQFKSTNTMKQILSKKREKREEEGGSFGEMKTSEVPKKETPSEVQAESSASLNALVESVKRKSAGAALYKGKGKRTKTQQ